MVKRTQNGQKWPHEKPRRINWVLWRRIPVGQEKNYWLRAILCEGLPVGLGLQYPTNYVTHAYATFTTVDVRTIPRRKENHQPEEKPTLIKDRRFQNAEVRKLIEDNNVHVTTVKQSIFKTMLRCFQRRDGQGSKGDGIQIDSIKSRNQVQQP